MENEPVEVLNKRLIDRYGLFENGQPNWRIVWSEDQFEYRLGFYKKFDTNGNYIGMSQEEEFQYVPKYRQWIPNKWVLEKLVPVPELNNQELISKLSYEPIFPYMDNGFKALPPKWEITEFVINSILANMNSAKVGGVKKYTDPQADEKDPKIAVEAQLDRIEKLEEQLFGNETKVGDALAHESGISMTQDHYSKEH